MCFVACFSSFSVVEAEGAVTAVGGFDWGGVRGSIVRKETCDGYCKSSVILEQDGVVGIEADGWLRIAITTESSSSDKRSWRISGFEISLVGSIFTVENGPGTICEGSCMGLDVGDDVFESLAVFEALVSIVSE